MMYIREINKLKQINNDASTDLANAESKLMTLKEVTKYQVAKLEESVNKNDKLNDKFSSTVRT